MVAVVLVMIVEHFGGMWYMVATMIIIGREITISALREWMAEVGERKKIAVSQLGKVKTTVQMFSMFFILYQQPLLGLPSAEIGFVLLLIAALLTLWSMVSYLRQALT